MIKVNKEKIGLTFGAFDLFHIGHLNLLRQAKSRCDKLIVCISDDEYVKEYKGKKTIIPFEDRFRIIIACIYVDDVDIQSHGYSKRDAVKEYKPDVLFVGDDWSPQTYTGEGLGVPVFYLRHTDGVSTTLLVDKIKKL